MTEFISALKVVKVDKTDRQEKFRAEHAQMYVPTLVQTKPEGDGKTSITMALLDSGNLLAHAAIDAEFHKRLGVPLEKTKIWAQAGSKPSLEILGNSRGIYLRFPNIKKMFLVKPLVVKNLSCNLNLGAQFNYQTGFVPEKVIQSQSGRKINCSELDGVRIRLQFKEASNKTLRRTINNP